MQFLPTVALGDIGKSMGGSDAIAHPALLKAFQQAQLSSQYLIHCQTSLEKQVSIMNDEITSLHRVERKMAEKENRRDEKLKELKKESRAQKRLIAQYHRMLRKHNPDLAGRVVGHGDGSISLIERGRGIERVVNEEVDVKFGNARVSEEDEVDFYVKPTENYNEGEDGDEEGDGDLDNQKIGERGNEGENKMLSIDTNVASSPNPQQRKKEDRERKTQSPEGKRIRSSIDELFDRSSPSSPRNSSFAKEEELNKFRQLSPEQKKNPILESLRISGELDFSDSGSDDDVDEIAL